MNECGNGEIDKTSNLT